VPVVDDLHHVAALLGGERRNGPVVQDEKLHPRPRGDPQFQAGWDEAVTQALAAD
jgi:hypothetical protein